MAGAGNKITYLLEEKADVYINLVPGLKFWDMCAGEPLIRAMMGIVCDANLKPIIYDHTLKDYTIKNGILVAKNKKVFSVVNERLKLNLGHDLAYFK